MENETSPLSSNAGLYAAGEASSEFAKLAAAHDRLNGELMKSIQFSERFGRSLTKAFVSLAIEGRNVGDVVRSLGASLSKLALATAFKPLETALGGVLQNLVTSGVSGISASLAGGFAAPFTTAGNIAAPLDFPFAAAAGFVGDGGGLAPGAFGLGQAGGIAVNFNVTTPDAESFRRSETQLAAMLTRAVGLGQRNL
jgi:hypothetical protein